MKMTKRQRQKRMMLGAVATVLNAFTSLIDGLKEMVKSKDNLDKIIHQIDEKSILKNTATKGTRLKKDLAKIDLIDATFKVSGALVAFANKTQNTNLLSQVEITKSELERLTKIDLQNQADSIHTLGNKYIGQLGDYGITAEILAEFKNKINAYSHAMSDQDSGSTTRIAAGQALTDLFYQADTILEKELDKFIEQFNLSQPEFYSAYNAARVIKDTGSGSSGKPKSETPKN